MEDVINDMEHVNVVMDGKENNVISKNVDTIVEIMEIVIQLLENVFVILASMVTSVSTNPVH